MTEYIHYDPFNRQFTQTTKEKMFNTLINESYNGALPFVEVFEKILPYLFEKSGRYKKFYIIEVPILEICDRLDQATAPF